MNQGLNSDSPQKQGGGGGGLPTVLDEVAVEEILRYINGRENEEEGKGSRSSSQAAAKKSKKQKKAISCVIRNHASYNKLQELYTTFWQTD